MVDLSFLPNDLEAAKKFLQERNLEDNAENTRAKILCCWKSIDIQACPGSGKTTVLVTKLAWAIENWKLDGAGICVLSHTNVAKDEIKKKLTGSQANKLFSYPHFVGTIQEFVDKYIALPIMRSQMKKVWIIDTNFHNKRAEFILNNSYSDPEISKSCCWHKSQHRKFINGLRVIDDKLKYFDGNGEYVDFPLKDPQKSSYLGFKKIKKTLQDKGIYCYDELLFVAQNAIEQNLIPLGSLQNRFPLVLIDEAQDTNETQAKLLNAIFNPDKTIVERFGDADQQIFDFGEKATTDAFPRCNNLKLNETQRCSDAISRVASKFSLNKVQIQSCQKTDKGYSPTLILFDSKNKKSAQKVIQRFAELIPDDVKQCEESIIKVVGQVGENKDEQETSEFSRTICDYESNYLKPANHRIGRARNLYDAIENSRNAFLVEDENCQAIHIFFSSISFLLTEYFEGNREFNFAYRKVKELLSEEQLNSNGYKGKDLLKQLEIIYQDIVLNSSEYGKVAIKIKEALKKNNFIKYNLSYFENVSNTPKQQVHDHVTTPDDLTIELNTIAGIKGETLTAILILETFFYDHNIKNAIQVMVGQKQQNSWDEKRIKNFYVALTRPTDFLCLALPKDKFDELCNDMFVRAWLNESFNLDEKLVCNALE